MNEPKVTTCNPDKGGCGRAVYTSDVNDAGLCVYCAGNGTAKTATRPSAAVQGAKSALTDRSGE
jgi:hypothetical protein